MVGSRARAWFGGLSKMGRVGVVGGTALAVLIVGTAVASTPSITYGQQQVTEPLTFTTTHQDDDTMLTTDTPKIITPGVDGSQTVTYKITYQDGKEIKRQAMSHTVLKQPVNEVKTHGTKEIVTETATESIPFGTSTVNDGSMDKGTNKVTTAGVNGEKTVTYQVTKVKGGEVARAKTGEQVTTPAVTQVTAVGTKVVKPVATAPSSNCDPNYSGGCVPIDSDVDCGGGSGNGPSYFYGTARVIGSDIYGLDRDGDGLACE